MHDRFNMLCAELQMRIRNREAWPYREFKFLTGNSFDQLANLYGRMRKDDKEGFRKIFLNVSAELHNALKEAKSERPVNDRD